MEREQLEAAAAVAPAIEKKSDWVFFSSGSTLMDLTLGGGWLEGAVSNIIGDKSTGKTLEAIEALANFYLKYKEKARMRYAEAEAAFSAEFAATLGFPPTCTRPSKPLSTVEDFEADFMQFVRGGGPGLYILDSLDALTSEPEIAKFEKKMKAVLAEKEVSVDDDDESPAKIAGSYGAEKAKEMSKFFRMLTDEAAANNVHLMIISQVRDNVGVMYGEKVTRSGGRALDFYASQIMLLAEKGKLEKQILGQKRVVGVTVVLTNKKLKCGMPYRKAEHDILLGYGVDDEISMMRFLKLVSRMQADEEKALRTKIESARDQGNKEFLLQTREDLKARTIAVWNKIENELAPTIRKY